MRPAAALLLVALVTFVPLASAHGESHKTEEKVDLGVAKVTIVHDEDDGMAVCRVTVQGRMAPIPPYVHVGRACVPIPELPPAPEPPAVPPAP